MSRAGQAQQQSVRLHGQVQRLFYFGQQHAVGLRGRSSFQGEQDAQLGIDLQIGDGGRRELPGERRSGLAFGSRSLLLGSRSLLLGSTLLPECEDRQHRCHDCGDEQHTRDRRASSRRTPSRHVRPRPAGPDVVALDGGE